MISRRYERRTNNIVPTGELLMSSTGLARDIEARATLETETIL
jgi:hypothetical protein